MSDPHAKGDSSAAPTESPAGTGEGAQTALLALIKHRKQQVEGYDPDATQPPQPPIAT
jgi:hypothetical protein